MKALQTVFACVVVAAAAPFLCVIYMIAGALAWLRVVRDDLGFMFKALRG